MIFNDFWKVHYGVCIFFLLLFGGVCLSLYLQTILRLKEIERHDKTEADLREKESFLKTIIHSSSDAIAILDSKQIYKECNHIYAVAIGCTSPECLIGKSVKEVIPNELLPMIMENNQKVLDQTGELRCTQRYLDINGNYAWYDVLKNNYTDANDKAGILVIGRNVTEQYNTTKKLEENNIQLAKANIEDGLTNVGNRRYFDDYVRKQWMLHQCIEKPISLVFCDIDYFKLFNDNNGHVEGDVVLKSVADCLVQSLRSSDSVFRYGGEEFVLLLPNTSLDSAAEVAERAKQAIIKLNIPHKHSPVTDHVTMSFGVASVIPQQAHDHEMLVSEADNMLYEAKNKGRNQVQYAKY